MKYEPAKEILPILEDKHPYYKDFNQKILLESSEMDFAREKWNADGGATNVKALQTENDMSSPTLILLQEWIMSLIRCQLAWPNIGLSFPDTWIAKYGVGDGAISHNHFPALYSFVYFVECPKGSSPLVFTTSGKRIKAEEGKVVIFSGLLHHYVPKNKCEGRIVVSGNMSAILPRTKYQSIP